MQDRVFKNPKITVHWNTEIVDVFGEADHMKGVKLRDAKTGEEKDLHVRGLFYAIGHKPNTDLFKGQLELDDVGYVVTKPGSVETSVEGVFAAGDVQDHEFRQAISAAGTGCMAAMLAERWLSVNNLIQEFHQGEDSEIYNVEAAAEAKPETEDTFDPSKTRHVGGFALRKLYHESDRPILVKYASPQCGPCHTLKPILDKVINEFDGKIHYVEIDIEQDPTIAESAGVTGTPTIHVFKDKDKVGEIKGVKQKTQYRQLLESHL
ncbi:MAG TPA: thioredoxin domain-containing protein, partial [Thermosynechococcaceae cyanobacterium]